MATTPDHEWIQARLEALTAYASELAKLSPNQKEETSYGPLTALKLFLLAAGVDVYSKIATKQFDHTYYIDALSGGGVTRVKGLNEWLVGSPIIAATIPHTHFSEYHFIEKHPMRARGLKKRLDFLDENTELPLQRDRCYVHERDANKKIPELVSKLETDTPADGFRGVNYFTFVDNEGTDIYWSTIEALIPEPWGDLLITHPSTTISRKSGRSDEQKAEIDRYYGTDIWRQVDGEDSARELYMRRLADAGRPIQEWSRIESQQKSGRFYYDMIYATRETPGGSPYVDAMENMKRRINRFSGDDITGGFDILRGRTTLFEYMDEDGDTSTQSGLERFRDEPTE